jgi:hypothetical protein
LDGLRQYIGKMKIHKTTHPTSQATGVSIANPPILRKTGDPAAARRRASTYTQTSVAATTKTANTGTSQEITPTTLDPLPTKD